ncbi:30S ribosomal protein S18 [Candidatus Gottesmanbacteria bacterium RIFCSPHIGHO2_02_FULL_40_13]|uniref:Small ribosomal subunit protein bS18 n=1 Tax=Candidatus Gottesmanbacteria bacterium RIFCSPHIGHO2_02_FULL_40_13 TaxID=1798384 RepID=A0A1F6A7P4_9BACT|nr:MAG: 30S ribosomal protein S18 [Candidatus Gottesmanbacteria bacterium RIFCSPHIGHO2_02_FULL_40_13]
MIRKTRRVKRIRRFRECFYCKIGVWPDYKDIDSIGKFVTERGKIENRLVSGICQKHQKFLMISIKRARFLGLLPFIVRPS